MTDISALVAAQERLPDLNKEEAETLLAIIEETVEKIKNEITDKYEGISMKPDSVIQALNFKQNCLMTSQSVMNSLNMPTITAPGLLPPYPAP